MKIHSFSLVHREFRRTKLSVGTSRFNGGRDMSFEATIMHEQADKSFSPYFFIQSEDAGADRMPLKSTNVAVDIAGAIADVRVAQIYKNEGRRALEAIYVFPGSTRAAVYGMKMTVGERTIVANIEKKQEARQQYEQAKQQGKSASLLEQHRPNVFQMNVANIMPGDEIRVELSYTELLVPSDYMYEFVYPTVVGPRYPGSETEGIPAESWVENPFLQQDEAPTSSFDIQVKLSSGLPVQKVTCTSHHVDIQYSSQSSASIGLKASESEGGNRDYILKYRLAGGQIESGLLLFEGQPTLGLSQEGKTLPGISEEGSAENFFLLMAQPPEKVQEAELPPREYIFIMDVSGSMGGFPMEVSKTLLKDLIGRLNPQDRFNLLQFSFGSKVLSESGSIPADEKHIKQALKLLSVARGSGGTEIMPALKRAFSLPRSKGMACSVVVITDGYISVEPQVFEYIRQHLGEANLFAFGIGSSVNRHLIEGMAHIGGGEPFIVTKETEAPAQAATFRRYIQSPVLTNLELHVEGFETYDIEPPALPDLFAERPVLCFGKWRGKRQGKICLTGLVGEEEYRYEADLSTIEAQPEHAALRYLWARHSIMLLGDYNKLRQEQERIDRITELGLKYSLLTDYTSFIAVDSEVQNKKGQSATIRQPLPLPQGVSDMALGAAAPARAGMAIRRTSQFCKQKRPPLAQLREGVSASDEFNGDNICFEEDIHASYKRSIYHNAKIKSFGNKTFLVLEDGSWIDREHKSGAALIRIQRNSEAYKALIDAIPELEKYFDLGDCVLVNLGRYSVEITPEGKTSLEWTRLRRLQAAWRRTVRQMNKAS
ncbi:MAG: VWA domain-containing protein [bacterium]|nr:VWA domain-containing protein [bacterium]